MPSREQQARSGLTFQSPNEDYPYSDTYSLLKETLLVWKFQSPNEDYPYSDECVCYPFTATPTRFSPLTRITPTQIR